MLMPYAGATSFYALLPVYALFEPGVVIGRVTAALLAAFGLWGLGRLAGVAAGPAAAAAVVLILAVHPGFLSNTVFNDSGFAYWMAALGAACLALRRYVELPVAAWAALLGFACGVGVWTRLNFAWLVAAAVVGFLAGFGLRAVPPLRHVVAAVAGALLGSTPLLGYQVFTLGRVTLEYVASFDAIPRDSAFLVERLQQLAAALLYDDEHRRGMWDGPALAVWQVALIGVLTAAAVVSGFVGGRADDPRRRWHRAVSTAFLALAAVMMATRLPVRGHHFLTLVPLAAVVIVLTATRLTSRRPRAWPAVAVAAAVYVAVAVHWDGTARRALVRTGGEGLWSDATVKVARHLQTREGPRVRAVDWGFHTSIFVLTKGRVEVREMFWHGVDGPGAPDWSREIVPGGAYLSHVDPYVTPMGAAATARFREELARTGLSYRTTVFDDRRGRPHSELVEVAP
jgi:hypothetical protein